MRSLCRLLPIAALALAAVAPPVHAADTSAGIAQVIVPATKSGPIAGGTQVVVKAFGPGIGSTSQLWFGDTPAETTNVAVNGYACIPENPGPCPIADPAVTGWLISAIAPPGPAGKVDLSVHTGEVVLHGQTETSDDYTYIGASTITSVDPASGPLAGGTKIFIRLGGTWVQDPTVTVGGKPATDVLWGGSAGPGGTNVELISAIVPAGTSAGTVDVVVSGTNNAWDGTPAVPVVVRGATTTADDFTYVAPAPANAPAITGVSGGPAIAGIGGLITVRGKNLGGLKSVKVGARGASVLYATTTQIYALAPALPKGTYPVTVTTKVGTATAPTGLLYRSLF